MQHTNSNSFNLNLEGLLPHGTNINNFIHSTESLEKECNEKIKYSKKLKLFRPVNIKLLKGLTIKDIGKIFGYSREESSEIKKYTEFKFKKDDILQIINWAGRIKIGYFNNDANGEGCEIEKCEFFIENVNFIFVD